MSKRVLILFAVGAIALVAAVLLLKYELTKQFEDPTDETDQDTDPTDKTDQDTDPTDETDQDTDPTDETDQDKKPDTDPVQSKLNNGALTFKEQDPNSHV